MTTSFHLPNIRTLLTEGFTADELRRLCYDDFRPVYDQFAANTGKAEIIDRLLEFAERRGQLETLLAWAKTQNPAQYDQHQPYQTTPSSPASLPSPSSSHPCSLRVFLCHSSGDKPAVRGLYQRLRADGFDPWLDEEELLPGQEWQREIPQAVRSADVVLVCLSPQSITKAGYVQKEIKFTLDVADEQPEGTIFLIPLRLEPCEVPERLSRWQWVDLFNERGYERLLRLLRVRAEALVILRPEAEESPSTPPAEKPAASRGTLHPVQRDMPPVTPTPPDRMTITRPIHLELVRVPAGEFLMGSDPAKDKNARPEEQPQHCVYASEFYIGKYPITNEQYAAFVKATKHRAPDHWKNGQIPAGKENHPVVVVSWNDAVVFCQWLSGETGQPFRLPTEAEWEKAARGTDGRIYPWGDGWDKTRLNSREGGPGDTTPVGHYSPIGDSPYGAADMCGNVWEWCQKKWLDSYKDYYDNDLEGMFPQVLRGGAFYNYDGNIRCAVRYWYKPDLRDWDLGFRVCVVGVSPGIPRSGSPQIF